jgi:nitrogen regulatory protein P-II 2
LVQAIASHRSTSGFPGDGYPAWLQTAVASPPDTVSLARKLHRAMPKSERSTGGQSMKLVTAIIKPFKLDDVRQALSEVGVSGITVTEVRGFGRQKGHTELYRGAEYQVDFLPKLKLETAVTDDLLPLAIEAIQQSAATGKIGDGKIFVTTIGEIMRIRTGETGAQAI